MGVPQLVDESTLGQTSLDDGAGFLRESRCAVAISACARSDRNCLGLWDTCPAPAKARGTANDRGQVSHKAQGRKPRRVPRWWSQPKAIWRFGGARWCWPQSRGHRSICSTPAQPHPHDPCACSAPCSSARRSPLGRSQPCGGAPVVEDARPMAAVGRCGTCCSWPACTRRWWSPNGLPARQRLQDRQRPAAVRAYVDGLLRLGTHDRARVVGR